MAEITIRTLRIACDKCNAEITQWIRWQLKYINNTN